MTSPNINSLSCKTENEQSAKLPWHMGRFEPIKKCIECKCVIIPSRINLHCFDISRLSIFIEFLFHAPCHIAPAKQNIFYTRTLMHVLYYLLIKKQLLTMAMLQGLYHHILLCSRHLLVDVGY